MFVDLTYLPLVYIQPTPGALIKHENEQKSILTHHSHGPCYSLHILSLPNAPTSVVVS